MRVLPKWAIHAAAISGLFVSTPGLAGPRAVEAPLVCSRGPKRQSFRAAVTLPAAQSIGSRFTVRIDSFPSGKISHVGLKYIYDMTADYALPAGAKYVKGSARIVPGTGTPNVRAGARVWHDASGIHLLLPARVKNGSGYTPPSLEFQLEVDAAAGTELAIQLRRCRVSAKVFLLGNVGTTCVPEPAPYTIGTTRALPRKRE
jgi:hypothetical protein